MDLYQIIDEAITLNASDIHITVDLSPVARINGKFKKLSNELLSNNDVYNLVNQITDESLMNKIKEYSLRYAIKPGITGWAQVNGLRGERNIERVKMRVSYDLWYIQHWSIALDIKIMLRTIGVMIKKQ